MRSFLKAFMPVGGNTRLLVERVHSLQFFSGKFLNSRLDYGNNFLMFIEIWSKAFKPNHVQGPASLKGPVDMEVLSWGFGFVQIG